jgi:energy-coupling factor transport system permease protein
MLVGGVVVSTVAVWTAGRRVGRTRYRPAPWRWPETVVAGSGVLVGLAGWWMSHHQIDLAYPSVAVAPTLSLVALLAAGIGLGGALCAPPVAIRAVVPAGGAA